MMKAADAINATATILSRMSFEDRAAVARVLTMPVGKIESITQTQQGAQITVTTGETITVHIGTVNLFQNSTIRQDLQGVIKPLEKEGITEFRAGKGSDEAVRVEQDEVVYFDPPAPKEEVFEDRISEEHVQIVTLSFQETNKWRFTQGDDGFFAAITDEEFVRKTRLHLITFGKGDVRGVIASWNSSAVIFQPFSSFVWTKMGSAPASRTISG